MKLKPVMPLALCAVTLLAQAILPANAANPTSGASTAQNPKERAWPKWYYYDYMGMREWRKGNKQRGMDLMDQSYRMAEASCGNSRVPLDNFTKKLLGDVIEHQCFHLLLWREVPKEKAENMSIKELTKRDVRGIPQSELEKQQRFLDKLSRFGQGTLGKKHYVVQRIDRQLEEILPPVPENEPDVANNTYGNNKRGIVFGQTPKWWRQQDSDVNPELFTRERRNLRHLVEPKQNDKKYNPAADPVTAGKGFVYIAGQKYDRNKVQNPGSSGWGGNTTVGAQAKNDPNDINTGWGAQGQGPDYRSNAINKWGIAGEERARGGQKNHAPAWGQDSSNKDSNGVDTGVQNAWGSSPSNQDDQNSQTGNYVGKPKN